MRGGARGGARGGCTAAVRRLLRAVRGVYVTLSQVAVARLGEDGQSQGGPRPLTGLWKAEVRVRER